MRGEEWDGIKLVDRKKLGPTTTVCLDPPPPDVPPGRFAVRILFGNKDRSLFPIGAQGAVAIYTGAALMRPCAAS